MLQKITIKNIALIESCEIEFSDKLNIMSGETGAGKSIIIDSLNFVLGARADKSLIRFNEKIACVEVIFSNLSDSVKNTLLSLGFDDEDDILIISRNMQENGKTENRINGKIAVTSMLKELSPLLIDVVSQHENQFLLKSQNHIKLVDNYCKDDIIILKDNISKLYKEKIYIDNELDDIGDNEKRFREIDILEYEINEIQQANIIENEEDELILERKKILNTEKIINSLINSKNNLNGDTNSALSLISFAIRELNTVLTYDEKIENQCQRLESIKIEIQDIDETLNDILQDYNFENGKLEKIEERLSLVRTIKKKYGRDIYEINSYLEKCINRLKDLKNADEKVAKLTNDKGIVESKLLKKANELSKSRKKAAIALENEITKELLDLSMKGTKFSIDFKGFADENNIKNISENGFDIVEFLISPNLGSPLMPLSKIASGGECSRIMLAIKVIVAKLDKINSIVFDEIDTGISGNVASVVACKMASVSKGRQVIAVTHLPQLAAMADSHYKIEKNQVKDSTVTNIINLNDNGKENEVARLIGGDNYNGSHAIPHAKSMIEWSENFKKTLS